MGPFSTLLPGPVFWGPAQYLERLREKLLARQAPQSHGHAFQVQECSDDHSKSFSLSRAEVDCLPGCGYYTILINIIYCAR